MPLEEVGQRGVPLIGVETILLVDPYPRQLLASARQLVTAPRELLLRLEQFEPCCQPLFTVVYFVIAFSPLVIGPQRRSSNANSLWDQNSSRSAGICAAFQSDNLQRHF